MSRQAIAHMCLVLKIFLIPRQIFEHRYATSSPNEKIFKWHCTKNARISIANVLFSELSFDVSF